MYLCIFGLECKCVFRIWDLLLLLLLFFLSFTLAVVFTLIRWMFEPASYSCDVHFFSLAVQVLKRFQLHAVTLSIHGFPFLFCFVWVCCIVFKRCCMWKTSTKERKKNRCSAFATIYSSKWSMMRAREKEFDIEQILIFYWHIFIANSETPMQTKPTNKSRHTVAPAWHIPALIQSLLPFFSFLSHIHTATLVRDMRNRVNMMLKRNFFFFSSFHFFC